MVTFYIIMSLIFALFTYLVCRENTHGVGQSILYGVLIGIFWPIVITFATGFLLVGRIKRSKTAEETVNGEDLTYEQVKEVVKILHEKNEDNEEKIVTEETDKEWSEIQETREDQ